MVDFPIELISLSWKNVKSNGHEPKPAELLTSLRGQRMKAIKNMNQLNFVTEGLRSVWPYIVLIDRLIGFRRVFWQLSERKQKPCQKLLRAH